MIVRICRKNGLVIKRKRHPNGITRADAAAQKTETLKKHGAVQCMSGTGKCYDNARMERFFATLKKEKRTQQK